MDVDPYVWIGVGVPVAAIALGLWRGRRGDAIEWGVAVAALACGVVALLVVAGGREEDVPAEQFTGGVVLFALLAGLVPAAVFYALAARLTRTPPLALIGLGLAAAVWVPGFTLVYVLAAQQLTCPPENHGCLF